MEQPRYQLVWEDFPAHEGATIITGERFFNKDDLGTAIEAFARVSRYHDTRFVRLDDYQTKASMAAFSREQREIEPRQAARMRALLNAALDVFGRPRIIKVEADTLLDQIRALLGTFLQQA